MKELAFWLIALLLTTASTAAAQQLVTNARSNVQALKAIALTSEKEYKENLSKAVALAKKHDWVIEKTYRDGSHLSLQGLDANGQPVYYITYNNTRSAATTRTDQLWSGGSLGLSLSGASPVVTNSLGVWDAGRVYEMHQELAGRVVQKDKATTADEHATHVAGTLIASGVNPFAKGMAFGVKQLQAYNFNNDLAEMAAAANTLLVSNHSYGSVAGWRHNPDRKGTKEDPYWEWWGDNDISKTEDYKFGYYNDVTASWDRVAFNAPFYLIVKSAGNNRNENGPAAGEPYYKRNKNGKFTLESARPADISDNKGYDIISTYGTAKNILTVGAVAPLANGYNQPSDVAISSFSSFGPTDDGRIKPDIVGGGVAVLSTHSDAKNAYKSLNGTSMASPNVAGTMLLLQEHYANLHEGTVMRAATLKGLAIHTADEAGTAPGPDYSYGWGLLNAARAATVISNPKQTHLLQELSLNLGQTQTIEVVASGDGPLKVTISWTDPEGNVTPVGAEALNNRTPRLVNDLDLRVSGRSNTFLPWKLNPIRPADAAFTGDNILDNVEQVLVPDAVPGETYTIRISHKGSLKNSQQDFSLLVSGVGGQAYCASTAASEAGTYIRTLQLGTYQAALAATGCATFRDLTGSSAISFQPGQSQELRVTAGTCNADAPKAAKIFIDWNSNGNFTDVGEETLLAASNDTFAATVTAPASAEPGTTIRMRLVLQETSTATAITSCGTYTRGETQDYRIRVEQQQHDVGITGIELVGATAACASPAQAVLVKLRNFGAAAQAAVPVTLRVLRDGTEVARLTSRYTAGLASFSEAEFVMEGSFPTEAGALYELVAYTELTEDAISRNNTTGRTIAIGTPAAAPQATAFRCGSDTHLSLLSSGGNNTFWYSSPAATVPVAAGNQVSVPLDQSVNTLYAAVSDFSATVGPAAKTFATGGGYNQFSPDVLFTAHAPMVLESARLYIGHGGKITFTVYTEAGAPVSSRTLTVQPTRTPAAPDVQPDDPSDVGAVYYLGLELPEPGDYRIGISYAEGATIFRNNQGVAGYPFGIPNVFTITGNTAGTEQTGYYYYFYDLKVRALGCRSERAPVQMGNGQTLPQPVISRSGHSLVSSAATGNRWYLDGKLIPGATDQELEPDRSGNYSVVTVQNGCISEEAVPYTFIYRPGVEEISPELIVYPNPSRDRFRIELETTQSEDISFEVSDMTGNLLYSGKVAQRNGQYEGVVDLSARASGIYLLRIYYGGKYHTRKLVLQR
ncbi:S8 family serine peptidase [Botryobacter ruber]|uniref:S8 family serine peptidase n=1 Tax=Botryobacter ruber TaxID=2171629 RepID=UPI000E0B83E2|nr:S8 family serine peptidase [Botryobacter ruber]